MSGSKHCIDAAALQDSMARKYNLSTSKSVKRNDNHKINRGASHSDRSSGNKFPITCPCCKCMINSQEVCSQCGYILSSDPMQQHQRVSERAPVETLAVRRGLVPPTSATSNPSSLPPVMSVIEWDYIEKNLKASRNIDAFCSICMEAFKNGNEVLLSCSHIFHRQCLLAFETYMKRNCERTCPMCRSPNYQKRITRLGSKAFETICVIKIQATWRGCKARNSYRLDLRLFYRQGKGDDRQKQKFYHKELSIYTEKFDKDAAARANEVDIMVSSLDSTLYESRELDLLFDRMLQARGQTSMLHGHPEYNNFDSDDDRYSVRHLAHSSDAKNGESGYSTKVCKAINDLEWTKIKMRAYARGIEECAICMSSCCEGKRELCLLSCTHIFHSKCIGSLETYLASSGADMPCCPVCRCSEYQKLSIQLEGTVPACKK